MMRLVRTLPILKLLLVAALLASASALAEPTTHATPYGYWAVDTQAEGNTVVTPMAWACSPWSAWQTVAYYCVGSATCGDGCPVRAKLLHRTQVCTDEEGHSFPNEEQKEVFSGCCTGGPGGQCPNPLTLDPLYELNFRGDDR